MGKLLGSIRGLHLLVGVGAVAGGWAAVSNPHSPLGMPAEALRTGPFSSFLVPGLFLMIVLGLGNLAAFGVSFLPWRYRSWLDGALGGILILWILIQCWILQAVVFLHVLFFGFGVIQGILALVLAYRHDVFPAGLIRRILFRKGS